MPSVTILVAVYNAAPFLPYCLQSLQRQTFRDIQIICIDDASTDNSPEIINEYAKHDTRIVPVFLDENHGQAYARNIGLQKAKGDIICMVDADDWISSDALELLVAAFDDQTDCVLFEVVKVFDNDTQELYALPPFETLTGKEAFRLSLTWKIHGIYGIRAHIHRLYPYDDSCRTYSDDNTTRLHYLSSRQVRCCKGIYYYRQRSNSVTHQISVRRFDYLRATESMHRQMKDHSIDRQLLHLYENQRWLILVGVYMFYHVHGHQLSDEDRKFGLQELRRCWQLIDRHALTSETTHKFGYYPCCCWTFFRIQEWIYFTLRGFLGKNI